MPLPTPIARQREVVCLPAGGHQVILGTAGSGKTTMAILRAAFLSDPEMPDCGRTLLLTFNKSLSGFIRSIGAAELQRVTVEHAHKFARGYLASRGLIAWNQVAHGWNREGLIRAAVEAVRTRFAPHPFFERPINFFSAEIEWLAGHGITSAEDYVAADRVGRAEARLERELRPVMWDIRNEYLVKRSAAGYRYDWDDIATAVSAALDADDGPRRYKHIVIDEGQDLAPEMLRALTKAIPADGSITFFADVAQQIYGHRMSWRAAGLHPVKVCDLPPS